MLYHNIKVENTVHFLLPPMHTSILVHIGTYMHPHTCMLHTYMHTDTHTFMNIHSHIHICKHN